MPPAPPVGASTAAVILVAALLFFAAGDVVILVLWMVGKRTGRPLLAKRWSLADLFLALQAVFAIIVTASFFGALALALQSPGAAPGISSAPARVTFATVMLPALLAQQAALVWVPLAVVRARYRGGLEDLGLLPLRRHWTHLLPLGVAAALALLPVVDLVETLLKRALLAPARGELARILEELSREANALTYLRPLLQEPAALAIFIVIVGIIGPVAEEVFFRGFAHRILRHRFGRRAGMVLSAGLFAVIHLNPLAVVPIFVIGLLLAWLYERTGSLAAPIGLHCANNLIVVCVSLAAPEFSLWDPLLPR